MERGVKTPAEELWALVVWAANSTRGRTGFAPVQRAFGMIPRDPLNTHVQDRLTGNQLSPEGQYLERVKSKGIAAGAFEEEMVKAKMTTVARAHAREGDVDPAIGNQKFCVGDECEVFKFPGNKDISGWKGPAEQGGEPVFIGATGGRCFRS